MHTRLLLALLAGAVLLLTGRSDAQSVTGCGAAAIGRTEAGNAATLAARADCFARARAVAAAAEAARRERLAAMQPPAPPSSPAPAAFDPGKPVTPIASNFDRAALLVPGYYQPHPASAAPDVVGAFRFICTFSHNSYDDPIVYPGQPGKSHLHTFFGNTGADAASTYQSLRTAGESTCNNRLNRSAYWIPALLTGAGKVVMPDFASIYYKRRPDGDPECLRQAARGCVDWPAGLRVVAGFDMARMGEAQPENRVWSFRCVSPGRPSVHHPTWPEALADCGGAGQIMAMVSFGGCWTGQLDSADHRSHLTHGSYGNWGYLKCPATHPYVVPELTEQVQWTVAADDGPLRFSSDMAGMAAGASFHADYMEGWDPPTRETWMRHCIGELLNCSDGELGDGTMLAYGPRPTTANPRIVEAPGRP